MPTAEQYRKALERLADSTEMAGAGEESQWTGAAAAELWHRIRFAKQALTDEFHELPPKEVRMTSEPRIIHEIDPETGITSQRLGGPAIQVYRRDDQPPVELQTHGRTVQEIACDAADQFGMKYADPADCRIAVDGVGMQPTLPASDLPAGYYQLAVIGRIV